ncbi:MAG: hypothetical protein KIG65_05315 [Eubacteriales bacterium]|nr:hypothetical protein [Eubacteriales bacterium]
MDFTYDYSKTPQAKYDKTHTTYIGLRIEGHRDADIIAALKGKAEQTEVKRLVRLALNKLNNKYTDAKAEVI